MTATIALAQLLPAWDEPEANLATIDDCARRAAAAGADLVVFPEQAVFGWDPRSAAGAEPVGGPMTGRLRETALRYKIGLVGSIREAGDGGIRNTALAIGDNGAELAAYGKRHLFAPGGEHETYAPGTVFSTFAWGGLCMGLAICYDLRFPGIFSAYRALGADAVLVPAAWPCSRLRHWRLFLRARALDNRLYVAGVSYASGATLIDRYCGGSLVADPEGEIAAEAGTDAELLLVTLDPSAIAEARASVDPAGG